MQNKKMLPLTDRRALVVYLQEMRYRRIAFQTLRYVYNMDGIDDCWTLANRAINPDGDNNFEFLAPQASSSFQTIIAQNISAVGTEREFQLSAQSNSASLELLFGGQVTTLCTIAEGYEPGKKYYLKLIGANFTLAKNSESNVIKSSTFVKGAAREPNAVTSIGARTNGSIGVYSLFSRGIVRDIRINGTLWPMADRNQTVQPSIPAGNNMTGTNLNPDRWVEIAK